MNSHESQAHNHPLAREHLLALKALQAEGQTVGARGYHMQLTGLFYWGFVIYRCDYSDDNLFERFIGNLREHAEIYHQRNKQDRTTGLYLRWTIVQDREALDGATKDHVRQRFIEWRDGLSVDRDGPGAEHRITPYLPRFEYCVHVGKDSLDSLKAYEDALESGQPALPVFFALVRAIQTPAGLPDDMDLDEDDEDEYDVNPANAPPPIEGSMEQDVGWIDVKTEDWVTLYEELHNDQAWYILYTRPPALVKF